MQIIPLTLPAFSTLHLQLWLRLAALRFLCFFAAISFDSKVLIEVQPSCALSDRCDSRCLSCVVAGCFACVCERCRSYWVSESGSSNGSASFWRLCNVRTLPHFVSSPYRSRSKNMVGSVLVKQSDLCTRLRKIGTEKTIA